MHIAKLIGQFCERYAIWCEDNYETAHFDAVIGQKMEVDFAGQTFQMTDPLTGEIMDIVVFAAILPYSQYIYAEGMLSIKVSQDLTGIIWKLEVILNKYFRLWE